MQSTIWAKHNRDQRAVTHYHIDIRDSYPGKKKRYMGKIDDGQRVTMVGTKLA